jgi:hypothetical protein
VIVTDGNAGAVLVCGAVGDELVLLQPDNTNARITAADAMKTSD